MNISKCMRCLLRRFPIVPFLVFFSATSFLFAQSEPEYRLPEILVTAGRLPIAYSHLSRSVELITESDIAFAPDYTIQGVLSAVPGIDVRRRGPGDVQSDVSVRGGTFEQTLVLLNGVPVSDPQTGHHNFNIPVALYDIERIEVLKGPGSRAFGANALNGVINIITRRPDNAGMRISASGGQFGTYSGLTSLSLLTGSASQTLTLQRSASDGYRDNTDYLTNTASYRLHIPFKNAVVGAQAGYTDKDFGANGFYSDRFPNQWERTKTGFAAVSGKLVTGAVTSSLLFSLRNGNDEFLLKRDNPAFYRNVHSTRNYNAAYSALLNWAGGTTIAGAEMQHDNITSTNLGKHERTSGGAFAEHQVEIFSGALLSAGGYAHTYDRFGWQFSPGADISYSLDDGLRFFGSYNKSFRIPTFTEMYYRDPANLGNDALKPEKSATAEIGAAYSLPALRASVTAFYRTSTDLIDWTRESVQQPWQVMNITSLVTRGVEASVVTASIPGPLKPWIRHIGIGYSYLDSGIDTRGELSKYVLEHLRHQATLDAAHDLPLGFQGSWRLRVLRRISQPETYAVADVRVSKEFDRLDMYISATNVFNTAYSEIGIIPMPGRWIQGGVSYRVSFQ